MNNQNNILKLGSKRFGRENWTFFSKENLPLFVNNEHCLKWYNDRNLVEVIGEFKARFTFEANIQDYVYDEFLLTPTERRCVICGAEDNLQKHHVVPHMYRKYMPEEYKSNNHHDVLIICYEHHHYYERFHSDRLKDELAERFSISNIEDLCKDRIKMIKPHVLTIQKCKTLLKHNISLPAETLTQLTRIIIGNTPILNYTDYDILTEEEIIVALKYHNKIIESNEEIDYVGTHHAKIIVDHYYNEGKLFDLVVEWRKDFVDNMKPQFLPVGWDVYRKKKLINIYDK